MTGNDSMVDMKPMAATTGALIQFRREVEFFLSYCHETGIETMGRRITRF